MTNIKNIGKELLGKSLNSFHKKTGLTQLEENNKMQDGILNGILSQVDDAYIEKTEQSNVIHLEGSGDGVVVLDGIEGNTMVNLASLRRMTRFASTGNMVCDYDGIYYKGSFYNTYYVSSIAQQPLSTLGMQQGKTYTLIQYQKLDKSIYNDDTTTPRQSGFIFYDKSSGTSVHLGKDALSEMINVGETKITKTKFTVDSRATHFDLRLFTASKSLASKEVSFSYWFILLEGDYTNKEVNFFEGLQSSFEEKINDEGKYEIEILSKTSKNLFNLKTVNQDWGYGNLNTVISSENLKYHSCESFDISSLRGKRMYAGCFRNGVLYKNGINFAILYDENKEKIGERFEITSTDGYIIPSNAKYMRLMIYSGGANTLTYINRDKYVVKLEPFVDGEKLIEHKCNKIKLLINEPLRAIGDVKDKLCIKDNRLIVERNCGEIILDGNIKYPDWHSSNMYIRKYSTSATGGFSTSCFCLGNIPNKINKWCSSLSNNFITQKSGQAFTPEIAKHGFLSDHPDLPNIYLCIGDDNSLTTGDLYNHMLLNPTKITYQLLEPYYEEVLNEYGEPILLEGYENGTLYIDSTIIPTTTVRYTPKMESFKTVKEVKDNNIMLTNDINDMIVPYMMEVDLMIMEKEVALMSHKNIRKIGEKDMTSMQKRTYDMLARLIKGKTLTVDECKTRVTVYLNADKITDGQAEELMLSIDEVYA